VLDRWIAPIGLTVMLVVGVLLALLLVRHHGRREQSRLARAERRHPFAAPGRTVLSFAVAAASVVAFIQIAREVVEGDARGFDERVAFAIHGLDGRTMDVVMSAATFIGSPLVIVPLSVLILGWAIRRRDYRAALALAIVLVTTEVLNVALKDTFARARPTLFEKIATLHSYSFPSGHSMAALAVYGMLGIVVTRLDRRHRRWFAFVAPIVIVLVGASRIYLGVHWPTDVLAGFAAGGFLLLAGAITLDGLPVAGAKSRTSGHHGHLDDVAPRS
jgi:membrane-associated phospholipid phosphatase